MTDDTERPDGEAPPTTAEIRRRSVMPRSEDPLVFPSGKIAQDPKRYNVPGAPASVADETPVTEPTDVHAGPAYEHDAPANESTAVAPVHPPVDVAARVDEGGRRKKWIVWASAIIGVLALVAGLIATLGGREPLVVASESPSPSPSPTAVASVGFGLLDDGIAEDEYPELALDRGDQYPQAYVMEAWVWDKAGPGWALSIAGGTYYGEHEEPYGDMAPRVYLNSPEGVAFELFSLPERFQEFPRMVAWHEDQRTAWIVASEGRTAALVDLTTGETDELTFRMSSGVSQSVELASSLADNTELWVARGNGWAETRAFTRSPAGEWTRVLAQHDYYFMDSWSSVSPEGDQVFFEIYSSTDSGFVSERSGAQGRPHALIYNLSTRTETFVRPNYPSWPDHCGFSVWTGRGPLVNCWSFDGSNRDEYFEVDAAGNLTPVDGYHVAPVADLVALGEYTDPTSGLTFVSEVGSSQTFDLRLTRNGEDILLATAGDRWTREGAWVTRLVEVEPVVYRIDTNDAGSFLVDTTNGLMSTVLGVRLRPSGGAYPISAVHYGEGTGIAYGATDYYG